MKTLFNWIIALVIIGSIMFMSFKLRENEQERNKEKYIGIVTSLLIDDEGEIHLVWITPDRILKTDASISTRKIRIIRTDTVLSTITYEHEKIVVYLSNDYELQYIVD